LTIITTTAEKIILIRDNPNNDRRNDSSKVNPVVELEEIKKMTRFNIIKVITNKPLITIARAK
jgi:hypothetical protein